MSTLYTNGYTIEFGHALLRLASAPDTADNHAFLAAWSGAEGGGATFNPFNSGQGALGATPYNPWVMNYPTAQIGLDATWANLQSTTFSYAPILDVLRRGGSATQAALGLANTPWGTGEGALRLLQGDGNLLPAPPQGTPLIGVGQPPRAPSGQTDGERIPYWATHVAEYRHPAAPPAPLTGLEVGPLDPGAFTVEWDITAGATHWLWDLFVNGATQHHDLTANHGRISGIKPGQSFTIKITPANGTVTGTPQTLTVTA